MFKNSFLNEQLMSFRHMMHRGRGMYIVGDSAYALRGFLLVPYSNAKPEDAFNYFLSCMRISVECAFEEIDGVLKYFGRG